jgi:acyl-CoA dehydrogenase
MISFELTEEQRLLEETVRAFAKEALRPAARTCEAAREVSPEIVAKHRELGLHTLTIPEALGGAGLGAVADVIVAEELAYGDPGIAAALTASHAAVGIVCALGDEAQQARWLTPVVERGAKLALAFSEADPPEASLRTCAAARGEAYVLDGEKVFVGQGASADAFVVVAQADAARGLEGIGVFVVSGADSAIRREPAQGTLGLGALRFARVAFEGAVVPGNARLGGADVAIAPLHRAFVHASLHAAALAVGTARAAFDYALRYAEERHAFGKPIGHFQAIAFMLSDMAMDVDAARWMVWRAAAQLDAGVPEAQAIAHAAIHAHEAASRVTTNAVQILGGAGFMRDHPVEKWMRDAKTLSLWGATPEWMSAVAQAAVLGEWCVPAIDALPWSGLQPALT